ncbi:SDR family oxidoreductase [Candidatus Woesearchaeota archaeon]|nr:SDR family oxidoreductase [Candidatus Woesearchaeota archaeon]
MKILVTGGAGFIGSNLVDALIEEGHEVVIVDNLSTGKKRNINKKAKFYRFDIRDKKLERIFKKEKFDIVNHHAAQIDVRHSVSDPLFDAEINILGAVNLLQNCINFKIQKFINVSSGGVIYGDNPELPAKENAEKGPLSPYGVSKLTIEYYLQFYNKIHGLKYTTLRYSNVYGLRQDPKGEAGVVAIFSNLMLHNKQPTIYGDGKQTRDYVFVKDVVNANLLAMQDGDNNAFNIGTGKETNVNELFASMKKIIGYTGEARYADARAGELQRSCLNIAKAKKLLKWEPMFTLEQGLKETIEWVKGC